MPQYQVIIPWQGVKKGQIAKMDKVHPALQANVMEVGASVNTPDDPAKLLEKAQAEANALRSQTEEELAKRVAEAQAQVQAEAQAIIDDAKAEAERIKAEAVKQAGDLTPATPEATTKSTKTK